MYNNCMHNQKKMMTGCSVTVMQLIFLNVLIRFGFYASSRFQEVYYITAGLDNCTVNGTRLEPCDTLQHVLTADRESLNSSSIVLNLLPGTHRLQRTSKLLFVANLNHLAIRPWSITQRADVRCEPLTNAFFQNITYLEIESVRFNFCTLRYSHQGDFEIANCIFENSRGMYAIMIGMNDLQFVTRVDVLNCTFSSNSGAVAVTNYTALTRSATRLTIQGSLFEDNQARTLGGFCGTSEYNLYLYGGCNGGALNVNNTELIIHDSHFISNTGRMGGAIRAKQSYVQLENTTFHKNHALGNGSSIFLDNSMAEVSNCFFIENLAEGNGAIASTQATQRSLLIKTLRFRNSAFENNHAMGNGGAVSLADTIAFFSQCQFINNSAASGGAISLQGPECSCTIAQCTIAFNKAGKDGGGLNCYNNGRMLFQGGGANSNLAAGAGGFALLSNCKLSVATYEYCIHGNQANKGGGMYAASSTIVVDFATVVATNTAKDYGGAFYLVNSSINLINHNVTFVGNRVTSGDGKGGAIFVQDSNCMQQHLQCFFNTLREKTKQLIFFNNSARRGPVLYGGLLQRCYFFFLSVNGDYLEKVSNSGASRLKEISQYKHAPMAVTSDPIKVCLCDNEGLVLDCSRREVTLQKMRGEVTVIMGAIIDQDQILQTSLVYAGYDELGVELGRGERWQNTSNSCTKLLYHIYTRKNVTATLTLKPDGQCKQSELSWITAHITVIPCSTGLQQNGDRCECEKRLANFSTACNIETHSVQRKGRVWLRYDEVHLKVHSNCPLDYCNFTSDSISLIHSDEQCANHRSGVICGACQDNYSIALGGSRCLRCPSNYTLAWLIPVFAVAGLALVALLLLLNMTISHGTLNGLIFYANVISISGLTSLQNCSIHPVLSVFIAWINLDLGVETCFYSGMDTYQKTWLQFAFPLYVWLLVGAIILASYYSSMAMRVFGRNNVAILATLFLLSYSKILKTITTALTFTTVLQASAGNSSDTLKPYKVWTPDGNIEYLTGKHVPLFAVALVVLIFLFLPYTLLLTFGQCLRSLPVRRRCVLKIIRGTAFISIMDAYHAPYSKRHRYWTGLTLLTRCVLFLAFASGYSDRKLLVNMYVTTLVLVGVFVIKMTCSMSTYKHFYLNLLELCFLLNLVILSATLSYLGGNSRSDSKICKCTSASISVSVAMFVGILANHAVLKLGKNRKLVGIKVAIKNHIHWKRNPTTIASKMPTTSSVQLREALLTSDDG